MMLLKASFDLIKTKMIKALILVLLNFKTIFEVNYDTFIVGIRVVLSKEKRMICHFSKKLNATKKK